MLPYLIAGAIGYAVAKLFEDETPKFADGGENNFGKPPILYSDIPYIHEASIDDAQKILKSGFVIGRNPIITKGVYTIPIVWKNEKFNPTNETQELTIWLKDGVEIFWTNSERPTDYYMGYGNKYYNNLYNKLNLGHKTPKDDFNNKDYQEDFCRRMEKWLKENNYVGVQQGGEIVITDLNAIDYIEPFERINTTFDSNNPDIRFDGGGRVSNYKQFYDNLQIEDGSKYIGQKFADVFPLFRRKQTSPADIRILLKEYNNLLSRLENDNYTTKGLKTADLNRLEKRQKYIDKNKYLSRFYLDPSGTIINFDNSDNAYASGGGIDSYYEELKPEVDYYSVNYDDMDGQKFRDNIFDTLTEAKALFNKLCVTGKTFERVDINTIELIAFYENGLYEVLDSKAFINTYPKFLNNLQIEDGSKYIGQKFTDVFPYLKRSDFTPYKFKIKVKRYNNILRRLSEDNYSTKSMKTADLNRLEKIEPTIEKVKYLSKFFCDNSKTILSFDN